MDHGVTYFGSIKAILKSHTHYAPDQANCNVYDNSTAIYLFPVDFTRR